MLLYNVCSNAAYPAIERPDPGVVSDCLPAVEPQRRQLPVPRANSPRGRLRRSGRGGNPRRDRASTVWAPSRTGAASAPPSHRDPGRSPPGLRQVRIRPRRPVVRRDLALALARGRCTYFRPRRSRSTRDPPRPLAVVALIWAAIAFARDRTIGERVGSIVADAD